MTEKFSYIVRVFLVIFLFVFSGQVKAEDIKVNSKISQVMVYPGSALVTRQAEFDLPSGDHIILFENIVPQINENTLTVKGQGSAEVKIYGASIKSDYLTQASDERVKSLQAQIEGIDDEIIALNNKQNVIAKQSEYLNSIKLFAGEQIPKDLVTKTPAVTELEQLGSYVTKSFTDLENQSEDIRLKLRELNRKKEALNQKLQELNSNNSKVKRSIAVEVQVVRPGKLTLSVSYLVGSVNWQPIYDARVVYDKKQVDLALFGLINQTTGEDWENTNLIISTSKPSLGGVMPELSSWTLKPYEPVMYQASRTKGSFNSKEDSMMLDAVSESMAGSPAPMKAQMAYAQTELKGVTAIFKITKPVTIKSDGAQHRVPITALMLPTQFEYATSPKLTPYAYLRSQVENNQESILLPGQVNVFLDGDYIGNSAIVKAIGIKEKFTLYMGADEGVTVKRDLLQQKSDDTLFGGIPSPNKTIHYSYKITVENYKSLPITVNLFDQIPVSGDDKIKVKDIKFNPDPLQKDYQDRKGVMLWSLNLTPREKKEISYSFVVEHPRNLNVEGL